MFSSRRAEPSTLKSKDTYIVPPIGKVLVETKNSTLHLVDPEAGPLYLHHSPYLTDIATLIEDGCLLK